MCVYLKIRYYLLLLTREDRGNLFKKRRRFFFTRKCGNKAEDGETKGDGITN